MAVRSVRRAPEMVGVKVQVKLGEEPVGVTEAKAQSSAGRMFSRSSSWVISKVRHPARLDVVEAGHHAAHFLERLEVDRGV